MSEPDEEMRAVIAAHGRVAPIIDALPRDIRWNVVLNLVKNMTLDEAALAKAPADPGHWEAFKELCDEFAIRVMELPDEYLEVVGLAPGGSCGQCPTCRAKAAAKAAVEATKAN